MQRLLYDLFYVALICVFFAVASAYTRGCDKL